MIGTPKSILSLCVATSARSQIPNPALSIAGTGRIRLSENPQGAVYTALSAAGHKVSRGLGKP
jgi:hypothetical protein